MVVFILHRVKPGLRGELSRWLIEPRAGVFLGNVSALVRDKLWERVCRGIAPEYDEAGAVLIHTARTEQGFDVRTYGVPAREVVDIEGLKLVRISEVLRYDVQKRARRTQPVGEVAKDPSRGKTKR